MDFSDIERLLIGKGVYSPNTGPASKIWFDAPLNTPNANTTLPRMGTTVTMAPDKLWINKKGQITLDPRIVYREGEPVIEVRTRYTHGMTGQGPFYYITTTYPCTQVPATLKDKKELLRNMATLHAMTLGHDYKLRSKL